MAAVNIFIFNSEGITTARARRSLVLALTRFCPVDTGRMLASIRQAANGAFIGAPYASYTNRRGSSAGWIDSAIRSDRYIARQRVIHNA